MTIAETLAKAVEQLPPEKQQQALTYVEKLAHDQPRQWISPEGIAAHVAYDISWEEFQALRREMWGTSTDREME